MYFSKFRWYFLEDNYLHVTLSKNDIENEERHVVNSEQLEDDQKTLVKYHTQSTSLISDVEKTFKSKNWFNNLTDDFCYSIEDLFFVKTKILSFK